MAIKPVAEAGGYGIVIGKTLNNETEEEPALQYPVDISYEDGTTVTINSDEEMEAAEEAAVWFTLFSSLPKSLVPAVPLRNCQKPNPKRAAVMDMLMPQPILSPKYTLQRLRVPPRIIPVATARMVSWGASRSTAG